MEPKKNPKEMENRLSRFREVASPRPLETFSDIGCGIGLGGLSKIYMINITVLSKFRQYKKKNWKLWKKI